MIRIRVQKRRSRPLALPWVLAISLLAPFLIGAGIFAAVGAGPLTAYGTMLRGAFGSWFTFSEVLVKAIPLIFTGLAVTVAARMLLWNIGAEGQLVWGGIFAAGTALYLRAWLPGGWLLPALFVAGFAGGAFWALGPALLRARWEVNEILSTLMLNYVAVIVMEHLYFGPWRDPMGRGFPGTAMLDGAAWLPRFFQTRIHLGIFAALAAAVLLHLVLRRTAWGFRIGVTGKNPRAARYAGYPVRRQQLTVLLVSGGIAGLAGMGEVCGIHLRLQQGLAVGYGYDGIIIAFLARLHPLGVVPVAVFLAALIVGGEQLQAALHLPAAISQVLEGMILFSILAGGFLADHRLVFTRRGRAVLREAEGER